MSKAFTNEDLTSDEVDLEIDVPNLGPTDRNYITPVGAKRLQDELRHLKLKERPEVTAVVSWAAGNGDRSENGDYTYGKKRLREIDRRIRYLSKQLQSAELVDPTTVAADHVLFGATVTIRDEADTERTYSIVGVDEIDLQRGRISWRSPLALALHKRKVGEIVEFASPKGVQEIEIITIVYKLID